MTSSSGEALRGILNAGYRKGATVPRVVGVGTAQSIKRFPVFGAKALAGLKDLPATLQSRSIRIAMKRRLPTELIERFRYREAARIAEPIRERLAEWSATSGLVGEVEDIPEGLSDRAADVWEPLLEIADTAGWGDRARRAALVLSGESLVEDATVGVRLLSDIRDMFGDDDKVFTAALLQRLHVMEESPWGDWYGKPMDARTLARLLRPYQVRSRKVRIGEATKQGWRRSDFEDVWARYLPRSPSEPASVPNSGTTFAAQGIPADPQTEHETEVERRNPLGDNDCSDVPHKPAPERGTAEASPEGAVRNLLEAFPDAAEVEYDPDKDPVHVPRSAAEWEELSRQVEEIQAWNAGVTKYEEGV